MNDNESRKWLYETLTKKGYNVGKNYAEFDSLMTSNSESRKWAYSTARELGYNVGKDYAEFEGLINPVQVPQGPDKAQPVLNVANEQEQNPTQVEQQPAAVQQQTDTVYPKDGYIFTEDQLEAVQNGAPVGLKEPSAPPAYGTPEWLQTKITDDVDPKNPYIGMTRQEAVNAIGKKYFNEWYGGQRDSESVVKDDDGEEIKYGGMGVYDKIKAEGAYITDNPEEINHLAVDVRNTYVNPVARRRVEQLMSKFKTANYTNADDIQALLDSRETQQAIESDLSKLGIRPTPEAYEGNEAAIAKDAANYKEFKDYYYNLLGENLENLLVEKYNWLPVNNSRSHVRWFRDSLLSGGSDAHEDRIEGREVSGLLGDHFMPAINHALQQGEVKAQQAFADTYTTPMDRGFSLVQANKNANAERDPDKILKSLRETVSTTLLDILDDEKLTKEIFDRAQAKGMSEVDYFDKYVAPQIQSALAQRFESEAVKLNLPKSTTEYILRGLSEDNIIAMALNGYTRPESLNHVIQQGEALTEQGKNPNVSPGLFAQGSRLATGMAADFWLWGGWGKVGSSVTGRLLSQRVSALATEKGITEAAARRLLEEEGKQYLGKGVVEGMMRHIPQSAVTMGGAEGTTELVRGIRDRETVGEIIGNTLGATMRGGVTGTAFGVTGGAMNRLTSQLAGPTRLLGKLAGYEVEAATMYTTEELQRMAAGEDAFENPFEGLINANVKLGFIKASANPFATFGKFIEAVGNPKKAVGNAMKPDLGTLTEEDVADIMQSQDGKELLDAITSMRPARYDRREGERQGIVSQEDAERGAEAYRQFMLDPDRPFERKQKVARLLGGILPPPGHEVKVEINDPDGESAGPTVVRTRDIDGQTIREIHFDSREEAEAAIENMRGDLFRNTTQALEEKVNAVDSYTRFSDYFNEAYSIAAEKLAAGEELTKAEKQAVFLYQHQDELLDIYKDIQAGAELSEDGQNLADIYRQHFEGYVQSGKARNAFVSDFEREHGLESGAVEEAMKKEVLTPEDARLLQQYQEAMRKHLAEVGGLAENGQKMHDAIDGSSQRLLPSGKQENGVKPDGEAGANDGTGANEPSGNTHSENIPPSGNNGGENIPSAAYSRGQEAIRSKDANALRQIGHETSLAKARMTRVFGNNQDLLRKAYEAVESGETDAFLSANGEALNEAQTDAVRRLDATAQALRGIDEAISEESAALSQQTEQDIRPYKNEQGEIIPIQLINGVTVYHKSGDLNNQYGTVNVTYAGKDGQPKTAQVAHKDIRQVGQPMPPEAFVQHQTQQQLEANERKYKSWIDGTDFTTGNTLDLTLAGETVTFTIQGFFANGDMKLADGEGKAIRMTKDEVTQYLQATEAKRIEEELAGEQAAWREQARQQREAERAAVEAQRQERFRNGIVGYSESKPDYSAPESDPAVVAEYLLSLAENGQKMHGEEETGTTAEDGEGRAAAREKVLKNIQGEKDLLLQNEQQARQQWQEAQDWLDANDGISDPVEQSKAIQQRRGAELALQNISERQKKWAAVRDQIMTKAEKEAFVQERRQRVSSLRPKNVDAIDNIEPYQTVYEENGIDVTNAEAISKHLLDNYREQGEAEAAINAERITLRNYQRDQVQPEIDRLRQLVDDYVQGRSEYDDATLRQITQDLAQVEAYQSALMGKARDLKSVVDRLPGIYAERNKAAFAELPAATQRMSRFDRAKTVQDKLRIAREVYGDDPSASVLFDDIDVPQDVHELVAMNMPVKGISWEGYNQGEHHVRGLQEELGSQYSRGIGRSHDVNGFHTYLAPKGQGRGIEEVVHDIYENQPEVNGEKRYDTQEIRNALLELITSAEKPTDIRDYVVNRRIQQAEEYMQAAEEYEARAAELYEMEQPENVAAAEWRETVDVSWMTPDVQAYFDGAYAEYAESLAGDPATYEDAVRQLLTEDAEQFNALDYDRQRNNETADAGSDRVDEVAQSAGVEERGREGQETVPGAQVDNQVGVTGHQAEVPERSKRPSGTDRTDASLPVQEARGREGEQRVDAALTPATDAERDAVAAAEQRLARLKSDAEHNSRVRGTLDNVRRQTDAFAENPAGEPAGTVATPENIAKRVDVSEDYETESGPHGDIYRAPVIVDGKHQAVKVDAPDSKGNYNGSYYEYDGKRFGDLQELVQHIDEAQPQQPTDAVSQLLAEAKKRQEIADIKPIGTGDFGEIYDQFKGKPQEAIDFLTRKKGGEAIGALHHKEVGDIDLVWGEEGTGKSDGYGLAKLVKYHPEVLRDLQGILDTMTVKQRGANRIRLHSQSHEAAVSLDYYGKEKKWLLTAYEKGNPTAIDKTMDTAENPKDVQSDTALLQTDRISMVKEPSPAATLGTPNGTSDNRAVAVGDNSSSEGKGSKNSANDQGNEPKSFAERLEMAKGETETSPTEAQKAAGNYKKGHITFRGYRMSIENPKGSVRSGVDRSGKPWSITMHDTYGYIGKKYGADGDHLDFFINDDNDLDNWTGRVFIVDQKNEDGTFDEHKVMYGYPNWASAKKAYESNYEPGWWDKHVMQMMGVRQVDFDKWLADSDHKRKPFADYFRTQHTETVSDPVEEVIADMRKRNLTPLTPKKVKPSWTKKELGEMDDDRIEQLLKKARRDLGTSRVIQATPSIERGSAKDKQLTENINKALADIEALKAEQTRRLQKVDNLLSVPAEEDIALRDVLIEDYLEPAGIKVHTDVAEAERILEKENDKSWSNSDGAIHHQKVTEPEILYQLEHGKSITRYRAMQLIDGKLYPPMSAKVDREMREPTEIGVWEQSEERPDLVKNGKFVLKKGQKGQTDVPAAYNPYFHTSTSGLNDQFTSAYKRPELVVVEVEIPESELSSGYRAEGAKDSVGDTDWHSGVVNGALPKERQRTVTLSRWSKVKRIVPDSEVADMIARQLEGLDIEVPYNVVTPNQRKELEKRGVRIGATPAGSVTEDINGNPTKKGKQHEESQENAEERTKPFHDLVDEMFNNPNFDKSAHSREHYDLGDTPVYMKAVGITGEHFTLPFKSIKTHMGKDADHNLTAYEWHEIPEAIKKPFLITTYGDKGGKFRLYTSVKVGEKFAVVGVDVVKVNKRKDVPMLELNRIKTVFGRDRYVMENGEKILAYDETMTPEQEALLRGHNFREYPSIQELSGDKGSENSANFQEKDDKSLMGVHNLSEEKLRKAIKQGGLANPSMAVIDTKNGMHSDYGEISLIPRASLIDSKTGRNAGTFAGDAWTPTYPQVEKQMSDKGRDAYYKDVNGVSEDRSLTGELKMVWDNYLEGRNPDNLAYWFFKEQGIEPEKIFFDSGYTEEQRKRYAELTDNGRKKFEEMTDEERAGVIAMMAEQDGISVEEKLAKYQMLRERNAKLVAKEDTKPFRKVVLQRTVDEINKYGISLSPVGDFLYGMKRALETDGKLNVDGTLSKARDKMQADGLKKDFKRWLEEKEQKYGVKEMLFDGYTRDGDRKYIPNTIENASRMMNRQAEANAGDQTGFGASRAMLLGKMYSLADIRKQKGKLKGIDEDSEQRYQAASDEMFQIVNALSDMQKISDNPFSNVDYANMRLNEALTKKDPIGYLNREYGYEISKDGEFAKGLSAMLQTLENLPVKYFETKFRRPVMLDEFAVAVVPESTSSEVVQALKDAGLDVRTYDGSDEGRKAVTMEAVGNRDDIRFFKTRNGQSYGFTQNGEIYVDPRIAKPDTPIHEYSHLWAEAMRIVNPEEWRHIVDLMKEARWTNGKGVKVSVWDDVKAEYPELQTDNEIADEVLAQFSGRRGRERLNDEYRRIEQNGEMEPEEKSTARKVLDNIRKALETFWHAVADFLHIHYNTAEEVADRVLRDLLNKVNPTEKVEEYYKGRRLTKEMQRIDRETKEAGTFMKAPNGERTMLSEKDWLAARTDSFKKWIGGDWTQGGSVFEGKLDKNGEPTAEYMKGYSLRPKKPGKPKKRDGESQADYFQRLKVWQRAIDEWPETEAMWKAVVRDKVNTEMPDEDAVRAEYEEKYTHDLAAWKKEHALPEDALPVTEADMPTPEGKSPFEYLKEMSSFRRQEAVWKTAPKHDDYMRMAEDEVTARLAQLDLAKHPLSNKSKNRDVAAKLRQIQQAMARQKAYDKGTVGAVVDFAKEYMRLGYGDNLGRGDIGSMLSAVRNATGSKNIKASVDRVMNIMVDSQIRNCENALWNMASVRELRLKDPGIEVQGKLELRGQRMIQSFRHATQERMTADEIAERMNELTMKMSADPEEAPMWEAEYDGLALARQYVTEIGDSRADLEELRKQRKDAEKEYGKSGRTYEEQQQLLEELDKAMLDNRIERISSYSTLLERLGGMIDGSIQGAREFVEREKTRVANIHRLANFDLAGKDAGAFHQEDWKKQLNNSSIPRFFMQPLATFEQMLKQFGSRNSNGEGYLYNHFMRKFIESTDNAWTGEKEAKAALDEKVQEVFGKKNMRWSDLYRIERKMPTADLEVIDQGEKRTFRLTQGNMLYIYMVNKMTDGAVKLRKMGISEEDVDLLRDQIDPRFLALGDWLQNDFLREKRVGYNKLHEKLFGAPMAAIDNYFPLRILSDARVKEEDVNNPNDGDTALPSTTTGAIIKRRANALPLDIMGADAFSVAIEHIEEMEQWAAFAEFNKDVNTLLSYTTFRNKVKNMNTIYGSGEQLWTAFRDTAKMAAGTYRPKVGITSVDKAVSNIAKGVTAAKISFRVYTALKQILSAPAFLHDANLKYFVEDSVTPWRAWLWAMNNMPVFEKRWKSRQAGDTRLMDNPTDWKLWHSHVVELASQWGMSPNAFVDGVTCAVGAHAIYRTRYDKYIKQGMNEIQAREKALQDAEIGYNLTQQSSEGAFVSAIQKDRTVAANALSVFRNSSMAYTRQWVDALRNLSHRAQKGYRDDAIRFMKGQLKEEGLSDREAEQAAKGEYKRGLWHDIARLLNMAFGVTIAWNLGGSLLYLLFGDDDEERKRIAEDAVIKGLIAGPIEGYAGGNIVSDMMGLSMTSDGISMKGLQNYEINPLPLFSDVQGMVKKFGHDEWAGIQDLFNIVVQAGVGVNPQTVTDVVNACIDYSRGDMATAQEIGLLIMRVMNAPQSGTTDNFYIDELGLNSEDAKKLSYEEMASRYAEYKFGKNVPVFGWFYSEEAKADKMDKLRKQFDKMVKERMGNLSEEELQGNFETSQSAEERRMLGKALADQLESEGTESRKKKKTDRIYLSKRNYKDITEDLLLTKAYRETGEAAKGEQDLKNEGASQAEIFQYRREHREQLERRRAIDQYRRKANKRKQQLGGDADEAVLNSIRQWRRDVLREVGVDVE